MNPRGEGLYIYIHFRQVLMFSSVDWTLKLRWMSYSCWVDSRKQALLLSLPFTSQALKCSSYSTSFFCWTPVQFFAFAFSAHLPSELIAGKVVYHGAADEIVPYFKALGEVHTL